MNQKLSAALKQLGLADLRQGAAIGDDTEEGRGEPRTVRSPIDGSTLAELHCASRDQVLQASAAASTAFPTWRDAPAPLRGESRRRHGETRRAKQTDTHATG